MNVVKVRNAYKSYGKGNKKHDVLKGLSLNIEEGTIYCLLGSSGCGKTSLLKSIVGMQSLDEGEIILFGEKLISNQLPNSCLETGFMPQNISLYDDFTIEETLDFFGNIYQVEEKLLSERKSMLKKLFELPSDDRKIKNCSGGQQRRVSLAVALIHDPKLVILDEPTVGLDTILREKIWNFLIDASHSDKKLTIIITTHYIEEASKADFCGLMRNGVLLDEDNPRNIIQKNNCQTLDEAFYNLCLTKKDRNDFTPGHNRDYGIELQGVKSDEFKSSTRDIPIRDSMKTNPRRKYFHKQTLKALIKKSFYQVIKDPVALFVGFSVVLILILIKLAVGQFPKLIKFGVIDGEIQSLTQCNDTLSNVVKINYINGTDGIEKICEMNKISCRFLNAIKEDNFADVILYENYEKASKDIKTGFITVLLQFSSSFSSSTQELLRNVEHDNEKELFNNREIDVQIDQTDFYLTFHIKRTLRDIYKNYTDSVFTDCKIPTKVNLSPIQFHTPIYGDNDLNVINYLGPCMTLVLFLFSFFFVTVTIFIDERLKGCWSRLFLSGVELSEMIFAHLLVHIIIGCINLSIFIPFLRYYYPITEQVDLILITTYFALHGLLGIVWGMISGAILNDYKAVGGLSVFSCYTLFFYSGLIWPNEALPNVVRQLVRYLVPTNLSVSGLIDMMHKGSDISASSVQIGLITIILWIILLSIFTVKILKNQKFSF